MKKQVLIFLILILLSSFVSAASFNDIIGFNAITGLVTGYPEIGCEGLCFANGCPSCWEKVDICGGYSSIPSGFFSKIITGAATSVDCCVPMHCGECKTCEGGSCVSICPSNQPVCTVDTTFCEDNTLYYCGSDGSGCCRTKEFLEEVDCCGDGDCGLGFVCEENICVPIVGGLTCIDNTLNGRCSESQQFGKPYRCEDGNLIPRSTICGCNIPYIPNQDNYCHVPYTCEDQGGNCMKDIECTNGTITITSFLNDCCKGRCTYPLLYQAGGINPPMVAPIICCLSTPLNVNETDIIYGRDYSSVYENITFEQQNFSNMTILPTKICSDLTPGGLCSKNKPFYCDNGILKIDAWKCGCFPGYKVSKESSLICEPISEDALKNIFYSDLQLSETEKRLVESPEYVKEVLVPEIPKSLNPLYSPKKEDIKVSMPTIPMYSPLPSGFVVKVQDKVIEARVVNGIPKIDFRI